MRTKSPQRKTLRRNNLSNYDNYINVSNRRKQLSRNLSDRRKLLRSRNLSEYDNYVSNKQSNEINPLYFLFGDDNDEIEKLKEQIKMLESKKDEECQKKLEQCNKELEQCKTNLESINTQMQSKIEEFNAKVAESNIKSESITKLFTDINTLNQNHTVNIANLNRTFEAQRKSMGDNFNREIQSLNNQKIVLEEQNKKHIKTISELGKIIESLTNEIERLNSDLKGRDENLIKLQGAIQDIKNINKPMQVRIVRYKKALEEKKSKIKQLEENLDNQTATDLQKEAEIKQLKGQILKNLENQTVTNAEKDAINKIYISKLTSEKNGLIIQLNKLSEELESLKKSDEELKTNLSAKKAEITSLTSGNNKLKAYIETLKNAQNNLKQTVESQKAEIHKYYEYNNNLNIELGKKTELVNTRVKVEEQNDKLIRELNNLSENINTVFNKFELKFVNPDTKSEDSVIPNYKYVNSAISQLEKFIDEKNNDIVEKQTLLTEAVKDNEKLKKIHTEKITEIRDQLVQVRDEEFENLNKKHTDEISSKEKEFKKNCEEKIKENTDSLNATHKINMDSLHVSLQSDCGRVQTQLIEKHNSEINKLKQNITRLTAENKTLTAEIENLKNSEINTRQQKIDELVKQIRDLHTQFLNTASNLQELKEKVGNSKKGDGKKKHKKYKRKSGKRRNKKM